MRPPEIHVEFLRRMAKSFSSRAIAATVSSGDHAHDESLWKATLGEVEDNFLDGPFEGEAMEKHVVISASHINATTGMQDKLQLDSVDEICGMARAWMQVGNDGLELVGKIFDLRKAYRQIGVCSEHLDFG